MYANGNIALTDSNYEVLALLRSHQFEDDVAMKVGEIYFATGSASSGTGTRQPAWILRASREEFVGWAVEKAREAVGDKKSKTRKLTLKQLLLLSKDSGVSSLGGEILEHEHCLLVADIKPSFKVESVGEGIGEEGSILEYCRTIFSEDSDCDRQELNAATRTAWIHIGLKPSLPLVVVV